MDLLVIPKRWGKGRQVFEHNLWSPEETNLLIGDVLSELIWQIPQNYLKIDYGREFFCHFAVAKRGYRGAEVARFLVVTTSGVIGAAYSGEMPELQKYQ